MKENKRVVCIGILVIVTMAAVVAGRAQSTVFGDSLVLPEPLPGSYADQQRAACAYQADAIPGMGYFGMPMGFQDRFTSPGLYYYARLPFYPGVPRALIYQSRPFPQPYGSYLPEIPASPAVADKPWTMR